MEIVEVDYKTYESVINVPYHIFGGAAFNHLNEDKCGKIYYLLFKDSKFRLGIIGGVRGIGFLSPFSAPFGGFTFLQEEIRISFIDEAIQLLSHWAKLKGLISLKITLPPTIYQSSFIAKQINCLYRNDFTIEKTDLNYAFLLNKINENYASSIWYNARKNLKLAVGNDFSFRPCELISEKETAYNVIKQNREARGFPLRMTWEQVQTSATVIPADFFLVFNKELLPIAAAIVFHVNEEIVQVIYWGDLPQFAHLKTMNYLSFKVFEHYSERMLQIIDIGPSTEDSIPNHGLCEFKESIGCDISCKFSFAKTIV